MNRRTVRLGQLAVVTVESDIRNGSIKLVSRIHGHPTIEPHEARALGEALIAAADDVAPYKVKP
jgi:hypothetical protein